MDNIKQDKMSQVLGILKKYEKNGSIKPAGETDKGIIYKIVRPASVSAINNELRKHYTSMELDEAVDYEKTAKELDTYAKKHGGIDKDDFQKTATLVRKIGRNSNVNVQDKANKELMHHVRTMDTDPRDRVAMILKKGGFKMVRGRIMREKTLTPNELKKREKIAKAIQRDNPDMPMDKKMAIATATAKRVTEKRDASKSASGYDLYHKDFSMAMKHAYDFAKKKGLIVKDSEIDDKVASGPRKPSTGKTNSYILKTNNPRRNLHVQVYNTGKSYELNMYIQ